MMRKQLFVYSLLILDIAIQYSYTVVAISRNEVDSIPTLDLETPIRDKSIPHFSRNRSFTNLLGVNEVNDLFLKNEV